jgi:tetratricopeptide (TPR) repeat protein
MFAPPGFDPAVEYLAMYDEGDAAQRSLLVPFVSWSCMRRPTSDARFGTSPRRHTSPTNALFAMWPLMRVDLHRAEAHVVAMTPGADRSGLMAIAAAARQGRALIALARGELSDVEVFIQQVQDLAGDEPMYALGVPWQRGVLAHWRGETETTVSLHEQVRTINPYPRLGSAALGVALADLGDDARATAEFDAAYADGPASLGRDWTYTGTIGALAELTARLGRRSEAAELDAILEPFDGQFLLDTCIHIRGSVAWLRAGLAACCGNLDKAVERYRRAEEFEAAQGAHALLARTRVDLADVLLQRATPGDDTDAERLLTLAETEAARMGAGLVEQRARRVRECRAAGDQTR